MPEAQCGFVQLYEKSVTLSPVEYFTVEYSIFKKFEKAIITVNWDVPQTSKQIYRKLKYREKLFRKFQFCLAFPEKWFCICQPNLAF